MLPDVKRNEENCIEEKKPLTISRRRVLQLLGASAVAAGMTGLLPAGLALAADQEWNRAVKVKPAKDINADPNVFETYIEAAPKNITIAPGVSVTVFAYNGQVPGPEIRVKQGDRVIVHFTNNLPDGYLSSIHWHGIELNNESDGTSVTQDFVQPGESFTYDFIAPRGGNFWYHPHVRGAQTVNAGLYGALIVEQPEEAQLIADGVLPEDELIIVLSDMALTESGQLKDIEAAPMLETMNGTEGDYLLVNGVQKPRFNLPAGKPVRLRLINTSITRYFRLGLDGHTFYRIGGEGGLLSRVRVEGGTTMGMRMPMPMPMPEGDGMNMNMMGTPIMIDLEYDEGEIVLGPAQRADVVLIPQGSPYDELTVMWKDFARGRHQMVMTPTGMMMIEADDDGQRPSIELLKLKLTGPENGGEFSIAAGDPLVADPGSLTADYVDSQIKLQSDMMAMMGGAPKETWFKIDNYSGVIGRTNFREANVGDVVEFEVHNHTDMHHPFHMHGFSFQPYRFMTMHHEMGHMDMWMVNAENEFVDTVDIPPHTSLFYRFVVSDRPDFGALVGSTDGGGAVGDWVFHCHIFQHGENGMMSFLRVSDD